MLGIEEIKIDLEKRLSNKRYEHCVRVADEASKLAKYYKVNEDTCTILEVTLCKGEK